MTEQNKANTKIDFPVTITENKEIAPGFYSMRLVIAEMPVKFDPGQFFQLRISEAGVDAKTLLRRPFAPSQYYPDGLAFTYAITGTGTSQMKEKPKGSTARVLGPLGRGYRLPEKDVTAILVGGGCGAPSLRPLAQELRTRGNRIMAVIGARTADLLLEKDGIGSLADDFILATDDGSEGYKGSVVGALEQALSTGRQSARIELFACGPHPMLKALAKFAMVHATACQISLEERMACGFGACMGCVVSTAEEKGMVYKKVCSDGPVFDATAILWD